MAPEEEKAEGQEAAVEEQEGALGLLDQAIAKTKAPKERLDELIKSLAGEAMKGTVTWDKNVSRTLAGAIAKIDALVSDQLAAIMHHAEFQKLEGSWRGLHHLIMNSETGEAMKIRVMNLSKKELQKDLERAVEFDQSQTFKKLYEDEFGTPGGQPFSALIGDYEFTGHPDDLGILENMSGAAAAAHCPFLSAASPELFGFESWTELTKPRDLAKVFESTEYVKWRSLRDSEDARYLVLTMPRTLARMPYGANTKAIEEFGYEEFKLDKSGRKAVDVPHDQYCWSNAAYALGTKLTAAFAEYGFCTAIRGHKYGRVDGLPSHTFLSDDGDVDLKCPTEVGITDRREKELSDLGFMPLSHYKNTDYAVFFGGQTVQKPTKYDDPDATSNAAISARLPYIMAASRFAHNLKVMGRDMIGDFKEAKDVQRELDRWIKKYVNGNPDSGSELRAKFPLREARVEVQEVPGKPGSYEAVAHLRPWMQMEELTASLRMVARIPEKK